MTRSITLAEFAEEADGCEGGEVSLRVDGTTPPRVVETLRRLRRLDLLTDEAVWALVGQAYIDPLHVYGTLRHLGGWEFLPLEFMVVRVLARKDTMPVAVMRVCLLSNEIVFVALEAGQLVQRSRITPEELEGKLRKRGSSEASVLSWLQGHVDETVAAGLTAAR